MVIPPSLPASLQIANSLRKSSEQTAPSVSPTLFPYPPVCWHNCQQFSIRSQ